MVGTNEVTILCVPRSDDVVDVLDVASPALVDGKIVVDTSTIDPDVEREQHDRVNATGARYLEAPLSGGTVGAEQGSLTLMVGGDADVLAAARPAARVHDRPHGQGPRPRLRVRGPIQDAAVQSGVVRQLLGAASAAGNGREDFSSMSKIVRALGGV